jgi:hypothetical protein
LLVFDEALVIDPRLVGLYAITVEPNEICERRRPASEHVPRLICGIPHATVIGSRTPSHECYGQHPVSCSEYGGWIDDHLRHPRANARQLARAVDDGRNVGAALRHLDGHGSEPGALGVAEALARFLVARCDSHLQGWRVVRQVVVDSAAHAPWEKCARRAVPLVADDLISLAGDPGRTNLARAQHIAAQRRAEQIAVHVDQAAVLADLGLDASPASPERWGIALRSAVGARSREQVARAVDRSLRA